MSAMARHCTYSWTRAGHATLSAVGFTLDRAAYAYESFCFLCACTRTGSLPVLQVIRGQQQDDYQPVLRRSWILYCAAVIKPPPHNGTLDPRDQLQTRSKARMGEAQQYQSQEKSNETQENETQRKASPFGEAGGYCSADKLQMSHTAPLSQHLHN